MEKVYLISYRAWI